MLIRNSNVGNRMDIVVTHSEKADPLFDTKIESITRE
jgi:hypothetical protein